MKICSNVYLFSGNLELNSNKLVGTIPDSIYNLILLSTLSLDENKITGTISTLIGQVTNLETFEVYGNQLEGSLPDTLYNLPALKRIRVGDNGLTGTVSDRLTLLNQTLQEFNAPNTNFSGAWPNAVFESLPELSKFMDAKLCLSPHRKHGSQLTCVVPWISHFDLARNGLDRNCQFSPLQCHHRRKFDSTYDCGL